MQPQRTAPPRIRWSDGTEGLEAPELPDDRMRLTVQPSRWETWVLSQREALAAKQALAVRAKHAA